MSAGPSPTDRILGLVQAAVYEITESGEFIDPSPALAELFLGKGARPEDLRRRQAQEFHAIDGQRLVLLNRVRAGAGNPVAEVVRLRLAVDEAWCRCTAVWDGHDRYRGVVVRLRDDDEPQRPHKMEIASLMHELRAPLVSIRSHAHYLVQHPDSPTARAKHANIEIDAEIALGLVDDMDLASRDRPPQPKPTLLSGQVVIPLKYGLGELAQRHGRQLNLQAERLQDIPPLRVDRGMMRQVFSNLLINAIKYAREDQGIVTVDIDWTRVGDEYRVVVGDHGVGISEDARDHIFQRYYRSDEAKRRDPTGTGLGLYLVGRIMTKHGGSISLRRSYDPTEFVLSLPIQLTVS